MAQLFNKEALEIALSVPAFTIPHHKVVNMARLVIIEAQKIFATCLELNEEHDFVRFIESNITDYALPINISKLNSLVPEAGSRFEKFQWKDMAYRLRKRPYDKTLPKKTVSCLMLTKRILGETDFPNYLGPRYTLHIRIWLRHRMLGW